MTRSLDEFAISWNREAGAVRAATSATLTIRNGPISRMVAVSAAQLREGRIMYRPVPGVDAEFRLELAMPDGRTQAESLQVLGFDTAPSLTLPVSASPPPSAAPKKAAPPVEALRQPRQMADRADTAGLVRRPVATPGRTEPQPLRRVSPVLSREVLDERRNAKGGVTISVLLRIDAAGAVETVKVVSSAGESGSSGSHLRLAALNAARQWKFRPATAGGKPVPAELTLAFTF